MKGSARVIGIIFGLALGAVELWLLKRLTDGIKTGGSPPLWAALLNILALPVFLVPVGLLKSGELPHAGIAAAGVLIIGALVLFVKNQKAEGSGK